MHSLLVCETRQGKILDGIYELITFAARLGADSSVLAIASESDLPKFNGAIFLADPLSAGEYNPDLHKHLVVSAAEKCRADAIVFTHSAYGWDLAPRVAALWKSALISEIVSASDGKFEVPCFNSKFRRVVMPKTPGMVLTVQAGAFAAAPAAGEPRIERLEVPSVERRIELAGYEPAPKKELDLGRAEVIVSVGRGVGKKENIPAIAALAKQLGGELGATRPVVDSGWLEYSHQVGSTGQVVSPKLYVACGISGAIQHLAGMKRSHFIVAVNKDREAPIGAVADVLVVADVMQFASALSSRLQK